MNDPTRERLPVVKADYPLGPVTTGRVLAGAMRVPSRLMAFVPPYVLVKSSLARGHGDGLAPVVLA